MDESPQPTRWRPLAVLAVLAVAVTVAILLAARGMGGTAPGERGSVKPGPNIGRNPTRYIPEDTDATSPVSQP